MRHQPDSTFADFQSARAEIAYLGRVLTETSERLAAQARMIDTSGHSLLPKIYRGRVETVCSDLLSDAGATIARLGLMTEDDAERELIAAQDLFDRL